MAGTDWSIESELIEACSISDDRLPSIAEATRQLGIIDATEGLTGIREIQGWRRGGAETYIYDFAVITPRRTIRLIAKACVSAPLRAHPLRDVVAEWVTRRELLGAHGVQTPKLHSAVHATIVEE